MSSRVPTRHVRNPMIAAVLAVLAGEATLFGSLALLIWFTAFFALNHAFFCLHEEPGLRRRFGEELPGLRAQCAALAAEVHALAPAAAIIDGYRPDDRRLGSAEIP